MGDIGVHEPPYRTRIPERAPQFVPNEEPIVTPAEVPAPERESEKVKVTPDGTPIEE